MYRMRIARISSRILVSAPHRNNLFSFFVGQHGRWVRYPRPCLLALRVTAKQLLAAPILAQRDITRFLVSRIPRDSVRFFLAKFLETRIVPQRIEHWIEPEQCRSKRQLNLSIMT